MGAWKRIFFYIINQDVARQHGKGCVQLSRHVIKLFRNYIWVSRALSRKFAETGNAFCTRPSQRSENERYAMVWTTDEPITSLTYFNAFVELFESKKSCRRRQSTWMTRFRKKPDKTDEHDFRTGKLKADRTQESLWLVWLLIVNGFQAHTVGHCFTKMSLARTSDESDCVDERTTTTKTTGTTSEPQVSHNDEYDSWQRTKKLDGGLYIISITVEWTVAQIVEEGSWNV